MEGPSSAGLPGTALPGVYVLQPISRYGNDIDWSWLARYRDNVVHRRWLILSICLLSMLATFIYSARQEPLYRAAATFLVADSRTLNSRGLPLETILRSHPRFLAEHALDQELLDPLLMQRFDLPGVDAPVALLDYLGIQNANLEDRLYFGRSVLARCTEVNVPDPKLPFVLSVNVTLDSPEMVSQVTNSLVERIMEAARIRQEESSRQRTSFLDSQAKAAEVDLWAAEEKLERFLDTNRKTSSPRLTLERERLERDLALKREFFVELRVQEAVSRLNERGSISAISILERAYPPREPSTLRMGTKVTLAGVGGLLLAVVLVCVAESVVWGRFRS